MTKYRTGDRVEIIHNPAPEMLSSITVGMSATVTTGGSHVIGLYFGRGLKARAWMVRDAKGNETVKLLQRSKEIWSCHSKSRICVAKIRR